MTNIDIYSNLGVSAIFGVVFSFFFSFLYKSAVRHAFARELEKLKQELSITSQYLKIASEAQFQTKKIVYQEFWEILLKIEKQSIDYCPNNKSADFDKIFQEFHDTYKANWFHINDSTFTPVKIIENEIYQGILQNLENTKSKEKINKALQEIAINIRIDLYGESNESDIKKSITKRYF